MSENDLKLGTFDDFDDFEAFNEEEAQTPHCACPKCLPTWIMTFADLMSLMLCFFVLLFSFAELNIIKYQQLALAIPGGFGVHAEPHELILGTSIIQRQFSPRITEDANKQLVQDVPIKQEQKRFLKVHTPGFAQMARPAVLLYSLLAEEIKAGTVSISVVRKQIIVRIDEKASFKRGKADFNPAFNPLLKRLALVIKVIGRPIVIAGHTDNIPIATQRYRSNWALSTARAVSVYHGLKRYTKIPKDRLMIAGYADSKPLQPNDTPEHRAKNRRVEIQFVFD